jgi:hypothetical protein
MSALSRLAVLFTSAAVLAACAASSTTPGLSSLEPSATVVASASVAAPTPTATPASSKGPFRSAFYGYVINSPDWSGTGAATKWDGTGSPGDGDPHVDFLLGPGLLVAFGLGEVTTGTLDDFVAAFRATNATVHPCPTAPETTQSTTVGGAPATLDTTHCPAGGEFVITAYVVKAGRAYIFFMHNGAEQEAAVRATFGTLLNAVSLES